MTKNELINFLGAPSPMEEDDSGRGSFQPIILVSAAVGFLAAGSEPGGLPPALGALAGVALLVLMALLLKVLDRLAAWTSVGVSGARYGIDLGLLRVSRADPEFRQPSLLRSAREILMMYYFRRAEQGKLTKAEKEQIKQALE